MKTQKAVALRITKLLLERGLDNKDLYKKITLSKQAISNIMNEKFNTTKLDTIIKICDGLNITLQEFFDDDLFKRENLDVE